MRIHPELAGAAAAADSVLARLMPKPSGKLSYSAVAKRCRVAARTPRSWRLRGHELTVPDEPARTLVSLLVEKEVGTGAQATLQNAWSQLLAGPQASLDRGDLTSATANSVSNATTNELSIKDRRLIVDQATVVLQEAYAHMPFKRALHAVDPVRRLRLLDYRLSQQEAGDQPEAAFHREMIDIFTSVRDLHTSYVVPHRYRRAVVTLPFRVEEYFETGPDGSPRAAYVASKVGHDEAEAAGFVEGSRITHWNGVPIRRAIELLAERQAAGNAPAAFARALDALSLRPMLSSMRPDEEWVDVTFATTDGTNEFRFYWTAQNAPEELLGDHIKVALGIDAQTHAVSAVRKELYGRKNQAWDKAAESRGGLNKPIKLRDNHLETFMPWAFRSHRTVDDQFGYIRIFSFNTRTPQAFIDEFARLTTELPKAGIIIDVRGNAGGSIVAAEGALQVLSADPIRPLRAQFTTSPLLLNICRAHAGARSNPQLAPWVRSLSVAIATGSSYSQGFPITSQAVLDKISTRYLGPVVLIVDALCYSATDMFAAGFADHGLGTVLGTADNTGAGGANVWRHSDLLKLAAKGADESPLRKLPRGVDFRVAVRRTTRVHDHEGEILEDLGVEIGTRHYMTLNDIFEGNVDLINGAAQALAAPR